MRYVLTILDLWGNDRDAAKAQIEAILAAGDAPEVVRQKLADFFASLEAPFSADSLKAIFAGFIAEILSGAPGYNSDAGGLA